MLSQPLTHPVYAMRRYLEPEFPGQAQPAGWEQHAEAHVFEIARESAVPSPSPGQAILVIDDEVAVQRALSRLLQRSGHDVTTANNGHEGLAALEERSYEVILCDVRMPDLDGPGFYRELERRHPRLLSRLIFLTGDTMSQETLAFFAQVDNARLEKPFSAQNVRYVIQQVLER